jgi:peptide methionine sulfoxide reductase MsrB
VKATYGAAGTGSTDGESVRECSRTWGNVLPDGPLDWGDLRYCMNSVALELDQAVGCSQRASEFVGLYLI